MAVPTLVADNHTKQDELDVPVGFDVIGHVVHWNHTPSFTEVSALLEPKSEVKPGQFIGVWHGRRGKSLVTIVQVGNSFEVNPNETPELSAAREVLGLDRGYGDEGISTRIFRLAESTCTEEFEIKAIETGWQLVGDGRSAATLCRAGDPVVLLPPEMVIATIGGKPDSSSGLFIGQTYGSDPVDVAITPQALQLHIGIFGNPGKGKSYLAGNLVEEAFSWGIPTLVLDINGEMLAATKALGGLVVTLPDPEKFGISLNLMTPPELVSVTPNAQPGTQYAELIEFAHERLKFEHKEKRITFDELRTKIEALGEATKVPKISIGAALARVSVLEKDPLIGGEFDFIDNLIKHRLVVLDCRYLSLRQTQLIAAAAARELQRKGRDMSRKADAGDVEAAKWFACYFVDEAHAIVPDNDKAVSTQVHYELARMGRHVRTGMILSSQSPQDLNTSVLKRLQTRFVFSLEKDQLRSIQGVLSDLDEKLIAQLPKLPRGICAVSGSGELVRHGFLARIRERRTPVGGKTPDVFQGRNKSPIKAE